MSLDPTATEDLYAVGAGQQVVAVDQYSDYPAGVPKTSLSGLTPNIEAIAKYNPSLVIASQDSGGLVAGLKKLGVPVLIEPPPPRSPRRTRRSSRSARRPATPRRRRRVVAGMQQQIAADVKQAGAGHKGLTYYWELSANPFYSATSTTFIGQVVGLFGLKNIADKASKPADGGYPQLSQEYIVTAKPQIIFLADNQAADGGQSPAVVAKRPGWSGIPAVQGQRGHRAERRRRLPLGPAPAASSSPRSPRRSSSVEVTIRCTEDSGVRKPAALGAAAAFLVVAALVAAFVGAADLNPLATAAALIDRALPFLHLPSGLSRSTGRCCSRSGCRGWCSARSSAGCSPWPGPATRACSATRSSTPGMLGASAGAGLGATLAIVYLGGAGPEAVPVAAFAGSLDRGRGRLCHRRRRRQAHRARRRRGHAAARRASPWAASSPPCRRSCCSAPRPTSRRCTAGCSARCRPRPGSR